jgi:ATP-dependent helicase/DNAse subunit B
MNYELSSKFLAGVKQKKDGEIVGDALTSAEEFDALYIQISNTVKKLMTELKGGNAGARPLRYGKNDPCGFCKMRPICRKD